MSLTIKTSQRQGYLVDEGDTRDYLFSDNAPMMAGPLMAVEPTSHIVKGYYRMHPEAYDQGEIGSCVAQAVGAMFCFVRNVYNRSRLQMYYEARRLIGMTEVDSGCYIRDMMKVTSQLGAGRESWWPYDTSKFKVDPPLKVDRDALLRRIMTYSRLTNRDDYRRCLLENHPFVGGITLYESFYSNDAAEHGIIPLPKTGERSKGGHAVIFIGYDDDFLNSTWAKQAIAKGFPMHSVPKRVYIARNSWGTWGRAGDFAIDADYVDSSTLCRDCWTQRKFEVGTNV